MSEEQSLAQILRSARERRGETLAEVLSRTGLSANVVRGLESAQFSVVEPVFMRMALRTYATHLELDAAELVARFERESGMDAPTVQAAVIPGSRTSQARPQSAHHPTLGTLGIIMGGLAALLAVVAVIFTHTPAPREGTDGGTGSAVHRQTASTAQVPVQTTPVRWPGPSPTSRTNTAAAATAGSAAGTTRATAPGVAAWRQPGTAVGRVDTAAVPEARADTSSRTSPSVPALRPAAVPERTSPDGAVIATSAVVETPTFADTLSALLEAPSPTGQVKRTPSVGNAPATEVPGDTSAEMDTSPERAAATQAEADQRLRSEAVQVPAGPDSLVRISVVAVDSTWLQITADGHVLFQGQLPRGARRSWQARDSLLVHSGRAHGLRYWFQNRLLANGRLGDPTRVLRFRATHRGVVLLNADLQPLDPLRAPLIGRP